MSALLRRVEGGGDLGTANIAIVVLDEDNQSVAGVMYPSNVVKDGVVVDYLTASRVVARLKQILEQKQGCTLERAAIAVPPGISEGNTKVIVNVVELAGFIVTQVLDEPVAAASALNIKNGAVVDVGGGTTGMSILKSGKVTFSADEPTGGRHMKLVIAGALGLPYAEAEEMKKRAGSAGLYPGATGGPENGQLGVGMVRYPAGKKYLFGRWREQLQPVCQRVQ